VGANSGIAERLRPVGRTARQHHLIGRCPTCRRRHSLERKIQIGTVLVRQFTALRDGDRFWYQRTLEPAELELVESSRLADIIRRNTTIGGEIADDVFHVVPAPGPGRSQR